MFSRNVPFGFPEIAHLDMKAVGRWNAMFAVPRNENLMADRHTLFSIVDWSVDPDTLVVEFNLQMISRKETMWFDSVDVIGVECLGYHQWKPIAQLKHASCVDLILPDPLVATSVSLTSEGVDWWNHRREYLRNGYCTIGLHTKLVVVASQRFNRDDHELLVCHLSTLTGEVYDVPEYFIQRD